MSQSDFSGPALFSYGFRPFFLAAGVLAALVVPLWMLIWTGHARLGGPFSPVDWHVHEMLFGYVPAALAGFLLTAIPNWTGRLPKQGWPLAALLALWIAGRLAVAGAGGLPAPAVLGIDVAFLLVLTAVIAVEIVAGRNWRNLKVLVPVLLFTGANVVFHVEAMTQGMAEVGRRLGFAVVIFLIMLIGGRIIPSFTRNWLSKRGEGPMPAPFGRFDAVSLGTAVLALGSGLRWPKTRPSPPRWGRGGPASLAAHPLAGDPVPALSAPPDAPRLLRLHSRWASWHWRRDTPCPVSTFSESVPSAA
jgi:uncharacterized protein involved in response to NO